MSGKLSGLVAGIRVGLASSPFIPSFKHYAYGSVASAGDEVKRLSETVEHRGRACKEAKDVYTRTFDAFKQYAASHPSSIGTDIYHNRENRCAEWLKGYYVWLSEILKGEAKEIEDTPVVPAPTIPDISIPELPSAEFPKVGWSGLGEKLGGGGLMRSFQLSAIVLMGFFLLIVYLMFYKHGAGKEVTVVGAK